MHNQSNILPHDTGAGPPGTHIHTERALDPQISLEDYNRTMLEYTQRQMSSFVDLGNVRNEGTSSRSSQSSGSGNSGASGNSSNGVLASQANGPPPTSAGSSTDGYHPGHKTRMSSQPRAGY